MILFGSIPIVTRQSVTEARSKLLHVCETLTEDSICAIRLGTAVSEMARLVLLRGSAGRLDLSLANEGDQLELLLEFMSNDVLEIPEFTRRFFKDITTLPAESGLSCLRARYLLSGVRHVDARVVSRAKKIFQKQSRDELMEELRNKHGELEESFENLKRTTSVKERMESELNVACDIQMGMLPVDFDAYAHRHEFEVFATLHPAREVGGDFYDFFLIDGNRLCICVGDVSGKGVPAALFMAMTKTLIKSRATNDFSPASILTHVNDELGRNNESCMFVTIWAAILDLKSGVMLFTNAGHNPPYIRRSSGELVRLDQLHGPVVAAIEGLAYGENEVQLEPGDFLIMYTDGVTESMNADGAFYGEAPLESSLAGDLDTVRTAVEAVVDGVWKFQGDAIQADDITVMVLLFCGDSNGEGLKALELRMANRLEEIARVIADFGAFAEANGLDENVRRSVNIALDELINNIVSYAYEGDEEHWIDVRIEFDRMHLSITIEDEGLPFNPFAQSVPDTTLSVEERQIGGLGVHLVRSIMDEVSYVRRTDRNVVNVIKHLEKKSSTKREETH